MWLRASGLFSGRELGGQACFEPNATLSRGEFLVMAMQVAATAWGPSGLLALFVMTAGPHGVAASVGCYAVGLVICYIMGFIVTNAMVSVEDVANA